HERHRSHVRSSLRRRARAAGGSAHRDSPAGQAMKSRAIVLATGLLAACHTPAFPEGTGRGVTSFDRDAPQGVEQYQRPTWKEGDRFVFRRGGVLRLPQRVVKADDEGYVLEHEITGVRTLLDRDLGLSGGEVPGDPLQERREVPPEPVLHWPLWV